MKILLTVHQFFPQYAAGTEVLTYSVAKNLIDRGHEVRVLTAYPTEEKILDELRCDEYFYEHIHIYRFFHSYEPMGDQTSLIELSFDNHLANRFFRQILDGYSPDVVHLFHLNRLGTGLIETAVNAGVPVFWTPTDFWSICPTGQLLLEDGNLCQGPSKYAGNCIKHFATNRRSASVGGIVKFFPTTALDFLSRSTQLGLLKSYPYCTEVKAIGSRLEKNINRLNLLDKIISPNRFMTDKLVSHGVHPDLIAEFAFGVNVPDVDGRGERLGPHNPFRIGFIGTLLPHKGCHILLEAYRLIPEGSSVLIIYGDGADSPDYFDKLKGLSAGRSDIEFRGTFHNSRINEILLDMDVLVIPSLWFENTPLVLYSAQFARCPVVASRFPGISTVIHDQVNGLLFEPGDFKDLAENLVKLISFPVIAKQLSANAIKPKSTSEYVDFIFDFWRQVKT